jgi:hypothetical protein
MRKDLIATALVISAAAASVAWGRPLVSFTRTPAEDVEAGFGPAAVAIGDLNGDGKPDLAVANGDGDDVSIILGDGQGTFVDSGETYPVSGDDEVATPVAIAIADFDDDEKPDIITANNFGNSVSVLLNLGGAVFDEPILTDVGSSPEGVVAGDFDGDDFPDVATVDSDDDTVTILKGAGDGGFTDSQTIEVGGEPQGLAAAYLDGDQNLDLVVSNSAGGTEATGSITVLKGFGGGVFEAQPEITVACGSRSCVPVAVAATDLNGDRMPDLALANNEGDSVSVLLGNGDLTFRAGANVNVPSTPLATVAADFTGDGVADVASLSYFEDKVTVLIGAGDGTFVTPANRLAQAADMGATALLLDDASAFPDGGSIEVGSARLEYVSKTGNTLNLAAALSNAVAASTAVTFAGVDVEVGRAPPGMAAGDLNADNKPDLVAASQDDDAVSVLLNTTPMTVCIGDCDESGDVTVDEILTMVNIALGNAPVADCLSGDANNDTQITVDEILSAVNNALNGCQV